MTFLQTLIGLHAPLQLEIGLRIVVAVTLIAATALLLQRVGTAQDPGSAHRLLSVALLGVIATPLLAVTLPTLPIPYDLPQGLAHIDNAPHMGPLRLAFAGLLGVEGAAASSTAFAGPGPLAWLTLGWLIGASLFGIRQAVRFSRLRAHRAPSAIAAPPRILALVARARSGIDVRPPVRVAVSDVYAVPVTFGWFRPVVLMPAVSAVWSDATIVSALQHELSHVARRDWCWQMVGVVTCALFWFHPLVWLVARAQRRTAELAADAQVVGAGTPASTYARALYEVATGQRAEDRHPRATVALSPASTLEGRIAALTGLGERRRAMSACLLLIVIGVTAATALSAPVHAAGCHAEALVAADSN